MSHYGVKIAAYASIGSTQFQKSPGPLADPKIVEIAAKHSKSPAQIIFAWHHHHGSVILSQTSKVERLAANLDFFDIKLSEEEIQAIDSLNTDKRYYNPVTWSGEPFKNIPYWC